MDYFDALIASSDGLLVVSVLLNLPLESSNSCPTREQQRQAAASLAVRSIEVAGMVEQAISGVGGRVISSGGMVLTAAIPADQIRLISELPQVKSIIPNQRVKILPQQP